VLDILRTTCIRNKSQIKNKIEIVKNAQESTAVVTRSQKKKEPLTKL